LLELFFVIRPFDEFSDVDHEESEEQLILVTHLLSLNDVTILESLLVLRIVLLQDEFSAPFLYQALAN
jgi:hypothetical protein